MADISTKAILQSKNTNEATQSNSWLSKVWAIFQRPSSTRVIRNLGGGEQLWVLVVGLDGCGVSTILKSLGMGDATKHALKRSLTIESLESKNMKIDSFDVGGSDYYRPSKERILGAAKLIVWVVDSTDRDRIVEARCELGAIARSHKESDSVFLVMANKQDVSGVLTLAEISEKMELAALEQIWHLQPTCALTGEGVIEGFEWLIRAATEAGHTAAGSHDLRRRVLTDVGSTPGR